MTMFSVEEIVVFINNLPKTETVMADVYRTFVLDPVSAVERQEFDGRMAPHREIRFHKVRHPATGVVTWGIEMP